jgi:hypothetical protein
MGRQSTVPLDELTPLPDERITIQVARDREREPGVESVLNSLILRHYTNPTDTKQLEIYGDPRKGESVKLELSDAEYRFVRRVFERFAETLKNSKTILVERE